MGHAVHQIPLQTLQLKVHPKAKLVCHMPSIIPSQYIWSDAGDEGMEGDDSEKSCHC